MQSDFFEKTTALTAPTVQMLNKSTGQVIVLGMHRSGTSALCGILHALGAYCGPRERLLENAEDNPKGFWERGDVHDACRLTLAARGGDWTIPFGWDEEAISLPVDEFRRAIRSILPELDAHAPWFIKEPRLCLLVQELLPLFTRPIFIHVTRNPLEVAQSLAYRNGLMLEHCLALWEEYTQRAFAASLGYPRLLFEYTQLLDDPFGVAQILYRDLTALNVDGLKAPQKEQISEWIEPTLHRQKTTKNICDILNKEQFELHQALSERSILTDSARRILSVSSRALLELLYEEHQRVAR